MAILNQLHRVTARPVGLTDDAKTRSNTAIANYANDLFAGEEIVTGVLAGSVATIDSSTGLYKACTQADAPMGLFGLDAAGEPNEFNRAKDHGVMTLVSLGFHAVELYETKTAASTYADDITYTAGDALFCSDNGFLTNETSTSGNIVAFVEKAPTASDVTMIIKLAI